MKKSIVFILLLLIPIVTAENLIFSDEGRFRITVTEYDPSPVQAGEYFDIWFRAELISGAQLKDLSIEPVTDYPFTLFTGERGAEEIPQLARNEKIFFKFRIKVAGDATSGEHEFRLRYRTQQNPNGYLSEPITIQVKSTESVLAVKEIFSNPKQVSQGSPVEVTIILKNQATNVIRDITTELLLVDSPLAPIGSTSEKRVFALQPDEETQVTYILLVEPDAASALYKVPLRITYEDNEGAQTEKEVSFGLLIGAEPAIQIDMEESTVFVKDTTGTIVISISNIGPSELKYVSLEIEDSEAYELLSTSRVYLGNLEPDDFETAEFTVYAKEEANINIKVTYRDAFNKLYEEERTLYLSIYSSSEAKKYGLIPANGIWGTIGLIIFVIFVIALMIEWRKHREFRKAVKKVTLSTLSCIIRTIKSLKPGNIKKVLNKIIHFIKSQ